MGAILDLTEMLKSPAGMVGALAIGAGAFFFIKWVFAEQKEDEK